MKALLWKEWRETLPVTLVGACILGLSAVLDLVQVSHVDGPQVYENTSWTWLAFGAPVYGLAVGVVQGLAERERDLWAYLVHRPIERGAIISAKIIAGLTAYAATTTIIFAATVYWATIPGQVPGPFDIHFVEPAVVDLLSGAVFYFAALLTVFPSTRLALRILPLVAAAGVTYVASIVPQFWLALTVLAVAIATEILAVGARFRTDGSYENERPFPENVASGAVVLCGLCVPLAILVSNVVLSPYARTVQGRALGVRLADTPWSQWVFTSDGRLALSKGIGAKTLSLRDERTGEALPIANGDESPRDGVYSSMDISVFDRTPASGYGYQNPSQWYRQVSGSPDNLYWYYSVADHYFLGYSPTTKRLTELIGSNGFCQPDFGTKPTPFAGDPAQVSWGADDPMTFGLEAFDNGIVDDQTAEIFSGGFYKIDFHDRTVTEIESAGAAGYQSIYWINMNQNGSGKADAIYVFEFPGRISVYRNGRLMFTAAISLPRGDTSVVRYLEKANRFVFESFAGPNPTPAIRDSRNIDVAEVNGDGSVRATYWLPPVTARRAAETPRRPYSPFIALGALTPLAFDGAAVLDKATFYADTGSFTAPVTFADGQLDPLDSEDRSYARAALFSSLIAGLACGGIAYPFAIRLKLSRASRRLWTLTMVPFGILGLATMACLARRAQTVLCSSCGLDRPLTLPHCPNCGEGFAANVPQPTDIFEPIAGREEVHT